MRRCRKGHDYAAGHCRLIGRYPQRFLTHIPLSHLQQAAAEVRAQRGIVRLKRQRLSEDIRGCSAVAVRKHDTGQRGADIVAAGSQSPGLRERRAGCLAVIGFQM
jgi:hypothetical protein